MKRLEDALTLGRWHGTPHLTRVGPPLFPQGTLLGLTTGKHRILHGVAGIRSSLLTPPAAAAAAATATAAVLFLLLGFLDELVENVDDALLSFPRRFPRVTLVQSPTRVVHQIDHFAELFRLAVEKLHEHLLSGDDESL